MGKIVIAFYILYLMVPEFLRILECFAWIKLSKFAQENEIHNLIVSSMLLLTRHYARNQVEEFENVHHSASSSPPPQMKELMIL